VLNHLNRREFISPVLTEDLLPSNVRIVYKSAVEDKTREDALPIVAYQVSQITLTPFHAAYSFGSSSGNTTAEMTGVISFNVSTTNEALSAELALEIASYCMSMHKEMQSYEMYIQSITIGNTERDQAGYFITSIQIQANLGKPTWNATKNESILREIGIRTTFH
jgi:hypothetical protein